MAAVERGVAFPLGSRGGRSSTEVLRHVVADALRGQQPAWADEAAAERDWRGGYLPHFRRLLEAGLASPRAWAAVADDGPASLRRRMVSVADDGTDIPAADLLSATPTRKLRTVTVEGQGTGEPLGLPYRGEHLTGTALTTQVSRWAAAGVLEPSAVDAVQEVLDHPEWLALPGRTVVVLGAGSQMGPTRSLLAWGATVAPVDLPSPRIWGPLVTHAAQSAGTLLVSVADDTPSPAVAATDDQRQALAELAGGDLLRDVPELAEWLTDLPGSPVLGNYTYADGGAHVRLSVAADLLAQRLRLHRPETALAFLATPTDTFAVPGEVVADATARYAARGRTGRAAAATLRAVSGGRLLLPAYAGAGPVAVNDALVAVQGPNYALAKRAQRWTATTARNAGSLVSLNVAPATRTRSVTKNRALAAAYAGAHHFGVEIFEPATVNALMAALLVHDLSTGARTGPAFWTDEADDAVHGGLWRVAYQPRTALNVAAVLGLPHALRPSGR